MAEGRTTEPGAQGRSWDELRQRYAARMARGAAIADGKVVAPQDTVALLEAVIEPGDRLCIEGNNQKHADFLAECLARTSPERLHGLHIVQSNIALAPHLDVFERGIAERLDFCYSGPQGLRLSRLVK
ncbi:MAG TPA: malonate decarboxylase subunit alpha, partial [Methylophilaceae bacterium]